MTWLDALWTVGSGIVTMLIILLICAAFIAYADTKKEQQRQRWPRKRDNGGSPDA